MAEIKKIKVSSLLTGESDNISNSSYHANSAYDGGNSNVEEIDFNTREDGLKDFSNSKVQKKYPEFSSICLGTLCKIPGLNTSFVPQGVCDIGGYTLITAYDSDSTKNSVVYLVDKETGSVKTINLEAKYHVGGVSYDEKTGSVYITGAGGAYQNEYKYSFVNRYNLEDFINGADNETVLATNKIQVDDNMSLKSSASKPGKSSPAYLTIEDGNLYVGNFANKDDKGIIKKYVLDSNGVIDKDSVQVMDNPYDNTQGLCLYNHEGEDYYIFSSSYGRGKDSEINIAKMDSSGNFETVNTVILPCMAEQVSVTSDGNIMVLFESCAKEYAYTADTSINDVCVLDFEGLLNN